VQNNLQKKVGGSTVGHAKVDDIRGLQVPFPPTKAEQGAIADALSDADALIESLEQLIAKKRDLKQGAMQELLTGKKRLPGFSCDWAVKRLEELAQLYQPVTISADVFTAHGYPVYGANGVVGYYSDFNHDSWQITVTCRGSTCGTVNKTVDRCWITGNAMVVNCDANNQTDKTFLYYLLASQDLSVCITGTGQPQIVRTPLADFDLNIPNDIKEQGAIAAILTDVDAEIAALETKLAKTRSLKQGMMQELFTGRVRFV
jgi:type I restriction enzyme S subunit